MSTIAGALSQLGYLDTLAARDTALHRLDPRAKLLTAMFFVLAVVSFGKYEISALLPYVVFPLFLALAGGIPPAFLARKLLIVSPFILFVGIFNPLIDREILLHLGSVGISGGWVSFASITLRATLTLSVVMLLLAVTGLNGIAAAMEKLGVPKIFTMQLLFLYRYIFVLTEEALRLTRARSLRTFGGQGGGFRPYASLLGHLLLRTLDRAERIHQAMLSRGFDGEMRIRRPLRFGARELWFTLGWTLLFAALRTFNLPVWLGDLVTGVLS
jgi:cobalt/nickel transport system permease protein